MKVQIIMCFEDMDRDLPTYPEDVKELKRFRDSKLFKHRTIDPSVL